MKQFSEFTEENILDGDKMKIEDIVNEEITIQGYRIKESKYKDKEYLTIQIIFKDKKFVVFTGSSVLLDQIKRYKAEIPFLTTIRKINKYYSLT